MDVSAVRAGIFFFFQAEDGIRDYKVTGVQTCALPISAVAIIREVGVAAGGCNIQFAINPRDGEMFVIEMNPRVSRSSALASKATGFPKIGRASCRERV